MDTKTTLPDVDDAIDVEPGRDGGKDAYYTTPEEGRA